MRANYLRNVNAMCFYVTMALCAQPFQTNLESASNDVPGDPHNH